MELRFQGLLLLEGLLHDLLELLDLLGRRLRLRFGCDAPRSLASDLGLEGLPNLDGPEGCAGPFAVAVAAEPLGECREGERSSLRRRRGGDRCGDGDTTGRVTCCDAVSSSSDPGLRPWLSL